MCNRHNKVLLQHASKKLQLSNCTRPRLEAHFQDFERVPDHRSQHASSQGALGLVTDCLLQRLTEADADRAVGGRPQARGLDAREEASQPHPGLELRPEAHETSDAEGVRLSRNMLLGIVGSQLTTASLLAP